MTDNPKQEEALDEAALNEEASRELEAMVASEETAPEADAADDGGAYAVQNGRAHCHNRSPDFRF